jgi:hypothetical protein
MESRRFKFEMPVQSQSAGVTSLSPSHRDSAARSARACHSGHSVTVGLRVAAADRDRGGFNAGELTQTRT